MAIIDVVKFDNQENILAYRFPASGLRLGTPVVVHPGQTAFFVKGGQIIKEFHPGTHYLTTENIPIIDSLINLPFGGESPWQAEIWFVSTIAKLDMRWGTPAPIPLLDPVLKTIVKVRGNGQYGIRITNPYRFVISLVGAIPSFDTDKLSAYLKGRVTTSISESISQAFTRENISILNINASLGHLSTQIGSELTSALSPAYGIEIVDFMIGMIDLADDEDVDRIKRAMAQQKCIEILGNENYRMTRSFDVMETAANNPGSGGDMASLGVGLAMASAIASGASSMLGNQFNVAGAPASSSTGIQFSVALPSGVVSGQSVEDIKRMIGAAEVGPSTLAWAPGMPSWTPLSSLAPFAPIFAATTPPPLPNENTPM